MKITFTLAVLLLIVTCDLMGFAIAFSVFPDLLLSTPDFLLPASASTDTRNIALGIVFGSYSLAQLIGTPILGALGDRNRKKSILVFSVLGTALALLLTAGSFVLNSISVLVISRFLAGLSGGNLTIAQAALANIASKQQLPRFMAAFSAAGALGWAIGPWCAAQIMDHSPKNLVNTVPFIFLTALFFLLFLCIINKKFKPDTLSTNQQTRIVKEIADVFRGRGIKSAFSTSIIVVTAWMMYQTFLPTYLVERYHFDDSSESLAYSLSAFWWLIGSLIAQFWIFRKLNARFVLRLLILIAPICLILFITISAQSAVWWTIVVANIGQSIVTICFYSILSILTHPTRQGSLFGCWNAGFALAGTVAPILSGWLINFWLGLPFLTAAIVISVTGAAYAFSRPTLRDTS